MVASFGRCMGFLDTGRSESWRQSCVVTSQLAKNLALTGNVSMLLHREGESSNKIFFFFLKFVAPRSCCQPSPSAGSPVVQGVSPHGPSNRQCSSSVAWEAGYISVLVLTGMKNSYWELANNFPSATRLFCFKALAFECMQTLRNVFALGACIKCRAPARSALSSRLTAQSHEEISLTISVI